jgi:hypothetical protein
MTESDFRLLIRFDYLKHAREITSRDDDHRRFRHTESLSFSKRSCFVLTEQGSAFAQSQIDFPNIRFLVEGISTRRKPSQGERLSPVWDNERHELRVGSEIVKRFKWPAANQETILAAFEEEGWPPRIDDPLPPQAEQDSKRRLHDTIKCLNKNQRNSLIHFRGDGTGEAIVWEFSENHNSR